MRYVYRNGAVVEADGERSAVAPKVHVMGDIQPYKSMIDGRMITSRSSHREHLRDNNCIEVGNEKMETKLKPPDGRARRELLHRQLANVSDREANRLLASLRGATRR
jgi:hypothetical protein